jgi:hypothetical protein
MRTTTYRAEFFTAADYAHRDFKARSPDEALQSARQFYEDNLVELDFRSYDDNAGLDQIQIWDSRRGAPATWQSDAYRLRKAAPEAPRRVAKHLPARSAIRRHRRSRNDALPHQRQSPRRDRHGHAAAGLTAVPARHHASKSERKARNG